MISNHKHIMEVD